MALYNVDALYENAGSADGYSQIGVERARDGRADALIARPSPSLLKSLDGHKMLVSRSAQDGRLRALGAVGPDGYGCVLADGSVSGGRLPTPDYVEFECSNVDDDERREIYRFRRDRMDWSAWYDSPKTAGSTILSVLSALHGNRKLIVACLLPFVDVSMRILLDARPLRRSRSASIFLRELRSHAKDTVRFIRRWGAGLCAGRDLAPKIVALALRDTWLHERRREFPSMVSLAVATILEVADACITSPDRWVCRQVGRVIEDATRIENWNDYRPDGAALSADGRYDPLDRNSVLLIIRKVDLMFDLIWHGWTFEPMQD